VDCLSKQRAGMFEVVISASDGRDWVFPPSCSDAVLADHFHEKEASPSGVPFSKKVSTGGEGVLFRK